MEQGLEPNHWTAQLTSRNGTTAIDEAKARMKTIDRWPTGGCEGWRKLRLELHATLAKRNWNNQSSRLPAKTGWVVELVQKPVDRIRMKRSYRVMMPGQLRTAPGLNQFLIELTLYLARKDH